jgi:hypothetical protein
MGSYIRTAPETVQLARRLYASMPGAEQPPEEEHATGGRLWGEVEHTAHYQFCEQIAVEIIRAAQAYSR